MWRKKCLSVKYLKCIIRQSSIRVENPMDFCVVPNDGCTLSDFRVSSTDMD